MGQALGPKTFLLQGLYPSFITRRHALCIPLFSLLSSLPILHFFRVFALAMRVLLFFSDVRVVSIFLSLGTIASAALSQNAACYYPNGVKATDDFPCFLDQDQSTCCGSGSICEASGLCKVGGSIGVSNLIRGSCTDKTWVSSACSSFCEGWPILVFSLHFLALTSDQNPQASDQTL